MGYENDYKFFLTYSIQRNEMMVSREIEGTWSYVAARAHIPQTFFKRSSNFSKKSAQNAVMNSSSQHLHYDEVLFLCFIWQLHSREQYRKPGYSTQKRIFVWWNPHAWSSLPLEMYRTVDPTKMMDHCVIRNNRRVRRTLPKGRYHTWYVDDDTCVVSHINLIGSHPHPLTHIHTQSLSHHRHIYLWLLWVSSGTQISDRTSQIQPYIIILPKNIGIDIDLRQCRTMMT